MNAVEYAFGIPVSPFVIYGFPMRITFGQQSPLATTAQKVKYGLENTNWVVFPFAFHQNRERSDRNCPFPLLNLRDENERIIIFFPQIAV